MGFRFQRRLNLSGGWGLNVAKSGGSVSYRNKIGALGTKGFSIRSGIPGISFRQSWGKGSGSGAIIAALAALVFSVVYVLVQLIFYLVPIIWQCIAWLALTSYDFCKYLTGRFNTWRSSRASTR